MFSLKKVVVVLSTLCLAFVRNPLTGAQTADTPRQPGAPQGATTAAPVFRERTPEYKVRQDDVLQISFALVPELNQSVTVQPDGFISLLNAGPLFVDGMTLPEIVLASTRAYATILNHPAISVNLQTFHEPFFVVSGQVLKPGQYSVRLGLTVAEGIATAGGLLPTAKTQLFLFRRDKNTEWAIVRKLNLRDVLSGKNTAEDIELKPGDMLFVPEKFIAEFRKYVPYSLGLYFNPSSSFF